MTNIFQRVETTNQPVIGFMVCKNQKKKQESMFSKGCFIQNLEFGISGMGWPYQMVVP
jgi:hypothetical protein